MRLLIVVLLLAACATPLQQLPDQDLQEAALRWAFANAGTDLESRAVYCIADSPSPVAGGADPDPGLLERFHRDTIPVRPLSSCRVDGDPRHNIVDRVTGASGLLFTVSPVRWQSRERGIVPIGFLQGSLWGAGWECVVERRGADWAVSRCDHILDV